MPAGDPHPDFDRQLESAGLLFDAHRYDQARALLVELAAREPEDARVARLLSEAQVELGEYRAGVEEARRGVRLDPENPRSHRVLASAYNELGNHYDARLSAAEAVRLGPDVSANWVSLAVNSRGRRRRQEALAAAERAIALAPDSDSGYVALSVVQARQKRWKACEAAARQALTIDPDEPASLNNLGLALLHQRRHDEAIDVLLAAGRREAEDPIIRRNVGKALESWAFGRRPTVGGMLAAGVVTFGFALLLFPLYLPYLLYVEIRGRRRLQAFPRELSHLAWEGRFVPRNWRDVRSSRAKIVVTGVVLYLTVRLLWLIFTGILG